MRQTSWISNNCSAFVEDQLFKFIPAELCVPHLITSCMQWWPSIRQIANRARFGVSSFPPPLPTPTPPLRPSISGLCRLLSLNCYIFPQVQRDCKLEHVYQEGLINSRLSCATKSGHAEENKEEFHFLFEVIVELSVQMFIHSSSESQSVIHRYSIHTSSKELKRKDSGESALSDFSYH